MFHSHFRLRSLILEYGSQIEEIAFVFDRMELGKKVDAVNNLRGLRVLQDLWDKAADSAPVEIEDIVPSSLEPMNPVVFHCRSSRRSLPPFNIVCCRPPVLSGEDTLWGYSETYAKTIIGPGYYTVHNSLVSPYGSVALDYTMVPPEAPSDWPKVRPNSVGLGRYVFDGMLTYLRQVARDVWVAANTKNDRETGSYYAMVRLL